MAGHLLFNSGSNESSLAPQFKWLDNTFKESCAEIFGKVHPSSSRMANVAMKVHCTAGIGGT